VRLPNKRSTRWSILPAIGINRYIDYKIIQGGFNIEKFNYFIRLLLRKMNRFSRSRLVLILDNASSHRSKDLIIICEEIGVRLKYLSLYSPNYNTIEESFSTLKA
jgi:transposase